MLRKALALTGICLAALGTSGNVQAADVVWSSPTTFVIHPVPCDVGTTFPCPFTVTESFTLPKWVKVILPGISTSAINPATNMFSNGFNIDFHSADINGSGFTFLSRDGYWVTEEGYPNYATVPLLPVNTLTITGSTGGDGTIYGDLLFLAPETSSWVLMLLGFGAVGTALRRHRRAPRRPAPLPA